MKTIPRDSDGQIDWQAVRDRLARRPEDTGGAASEREQAVLESRARILARVPLAAAAAGDVLEIVVLEIDRERYAIESQFVREIVRLPDMTPVPGAPDHLSGVMNLRGEILAVFDLAKLFGLGAAAPTDRARILVLGRERSEFGILADSVCEGAVLRADDVLDSQAAGIASSVPLRGVTRDTMQVLDGERLLQDARLFIDQEEQ